MKLIGPNCPTRETATTSTCIDRIISTPRLIHLNVYNGKCDVCNPFGTLLVTGVTMKILRPKKVYRVVKLLEIWKILK